MSLDPPPYLSSLQNHIRSRPIPWDGAVRAGTISDDQLSKIRAVDKVRKEQRKQIVDSDLDGYRTLFVGAQGRPSVLESAAKRQDVVQYILVLLKDLLDGLSRCPHSQQSLITMHRNSSSRSSSVRTLRPIQLVHASSNAIQ